MLDGVSYGRVFRKAGRSKDRHFTVLYRSNGSDEARLGLAISKKNTKLATARNRLKRLVRESFRQNKDQLAGLDVVVLNQRGTQTADNLTLFASLKKHWAACQKKGRGAASRN